MYYSPDTQQRFANTWEIRSAFPNVSFPSDVSDDTLADFGVFPVTSEPPVFNPQTHKAVDVGTEAGGPTGWRVQWSVVALTPEEIAAANSALQNSIVKQTQRRLDAFAQTRNYDGILSLCTYATSPTARFAAEGQYGVEARDATWAKLYDMLDEVNAGTRPMPSSFADVEPELPALVWPN